MIDFLTWSVFTEMGWSFFFGVYVIAVIGYFTCNQIEWMLSSYMERREKELKEDAPIKQAILRAMEESWPCDIYDYYFSERRHIFHNARSAVNHPGIVWWSIK